MLKEMTNMSGNVNISLERYHELLESERKYKQSYIEFVINRNELNKEKYEFKIGSEIKSKVIINKILRLIIKLLKNQYGRRYLITGVSYNCG